MMRKIIALLALTCLTLKVQAQNSYFQIFYEDTYWQWGEVIKTTHDGGYVLFGLGQVMIGAVKRTTAQITKIDSQGNILWKANYLSEVPDTFYLSASAITIENTDDGGFVLLSDEHSLQNGRDSSLITKVDSLGNVEWKTKIHKAEVPQTIYHQLSSITQTNDGGYIVVGDTAKPYSISADWWFYVMKLDSNGTIEMDTVLGRPDMDRAVGALAATDGHIYVLGRGYGDSSVYLAKFSGSMDFLWEKYFVDISGHNRPFAIMETKDSIVVIASIIYDTIVHIRYLDSSGTTIKETQFDGLPMKTVFPTINTADDGGFVFAGADNRGYPWDAFILKTDGDLNQEWVAFYSGVESLWFESVVQAHDGGFVALGTWTGQSDYNLFLAKVTADGINESENLVVSGLKVHVYPNPATDEVFLMITGDGGKFKLTILDIFGRIMDYGIQMNQWPARIQITDYPSGMYFYSITSDDNRVARGKLLVVGIK